LGQTNFEEFENLKNYNYKTHFEKRLTAYRAFYNKIHSRQPTLPPPIFLKSQMLIMIVIVKYYDYISEIPKKPANFNLKTS